ncbi:hypothetical protein ACFLWZ_01355 [Chloroflexota bacterium]
MSDVIDRADNIVVFVSESGVRRSVDGKSERLEVAKWFHACKTRDAEQELRPHKVKWNYDKAMFEPDEDNLGWVVI